MSPWLRRTLVSASLWASGCASLWLSFPSPEGYSAVLDTWAGADAASLARSWGAPAKVTQIGTDHYMWTYVRSVSTTTPVAYETTYDALHKSLVTKKTGGNTTTKWCRTEFEVTGGIIQTWRWEGNNCAAVAPPYLGAYVRRDETRDCLFVEAVDPRSTADRLGLKRGDCIVVVNKRVMKQPSDLEHLHGVRHAGDRIRVHYETEDGQFLVTAGPMYPHPSRQ